MSCTHQRRPPRRRRRALHIGICVLTIVLLPLTMLWIFQRRLIFQPDTASPGPAASYVDGLTDVILETSDGLELTAWYLPPTGQCSTTVLVAPGNAGNRAGRVELVSNLGARGIGVLLLEYRGYGANPGSPSESGLKLDAEAAWRFLNQRSEPTELIYFGESLGGGVVSTLALDYPPIALILRSPFVDLATVGQSSYPIIPVRLLLKDRFPVQENVSRIGVPLTVILGDHDRLIPPAQSRAVAAAGSGPTSLIEIAGADHNDSTLAHGPEVVQATLVAARCSGLPSTRKGSEIDAPKVVRDLEG